MQLRTEIDAEDTACFWKPLGDQLEQLFGLLLKFLLIGFYMCLEPCSKLTQLLSHQTFWSLLAVPHGAVAIAMDAKSSFPSTVWREHNWFPLVQLLADHFCQGMCLFRFLSSLRDACASGLTNDTKVVIVKLLHCVKMCYVQQIQNLGPTSYQSNMLNHSQRLAAHEVGVLLCQHSTGRLL